MHMRTRSFFCLLMSIPFCSLDHVLFNVSLSLCFPLIMSFPTSEEAVNREPALLDEHSVIKIGENKVSPHLHPPVHKEEQAFIAFRGHFLLWRPGLPCDQLRKAGVSDALYTRYLGQSTLNRLDTRGWNGSSCVSFDPPGRRRNSSSVWHCWEETEGNNGCQHISGVGYEVIFISMHWSSCHTVHEQGWKS